MQHLVRELSNILQPGMQKREANLLRFPTRNAAWARQHFRVGQCYNFRHFEYDGVAVRTCRSSHITLERVTIYGCPGHGFLSSGGVHHLHFDHCRILPRPGTPRSVSVSVDCLHVGNSLGQFIIEDCDFSGAGDDCINLHDNSSMGVERLGDHTLKALRVTESALQLEKGSCIELRNPDLSALGYTSRVEAVTYQPQEHTCILQLAEPLPPSLDHETVLFHRTFHTDHYIIRNCRFTNNRARGALLQGSYGLVENNLFENIQGAAIQIETGCESRWSEGQGVHDLLIRNNVIRHCDLNAWQMAVIYMGVYLPAGVPNTLCFRILKFAATPLWTVRAWQGTFPPAAMCRCTTIPLSTPHSWICRCPAMVPARWRPLSTVNGTKGFSSLPTAATVRRRKTRSFPRYCEKRAAVPQTGE